MKPNAEGQPDNKIPRRSFLNMLLGVASLPLIGTIAYPIFKYLWPSQEKESLKTGAFVEAAKTSELPPGASKTFQFGSQPGMVIHTKDGQYKALIATCTHLSCTVQYRKENGDIWCACHNGVYDINGKNVSGPPPRPLTSLKVVLKGKQILVTRG